MRSRLFRLGSEVPGDFSRVNPLALLRPRRERPRRRRAANQLDELTTFLGLVPPRAVGLPHPQPSTEGPAGPWAILNRSESPDATLLASKPAKTLSAALLQVPLSVCPGACKQPPPPQCPPAARKGVSCAIVGEAKAPRNNPALVAKLPIGNFRKIACALARR